MSDHEMDKTELQALAAVFMGAAHADGEYQWKEAEAIKEMLTRLCGGDLPADLNNYINEFEIATFDLEDTCEALDVSTPEKRRKLLEMVAEITGADRVHDMDESSFIIKFALIIGARKEEYDNLVVDFTEALAPPPIPDK